MSRRDHARTLLESLVRIPSLSGEEREVADVLAGLLGEAGMDVHRREDNLWFELGDGEDTLLLNSHLDVVPPSEGHPYPAFEPTVVDGKLYGRGSVDAKGCVAAICTAAIELAESGWLPPAGGRLVVALTTYEEMGGLKNGLEELRPHLPTLSSGIVGEPTSLVPITSQKGLLILRCVAEGRTAHAARAHLGDNAVVRAAADIRLLAEYRPERVHPLLGPTTVTVTTIEGGTARNVVPDRCTFHVDVRSTPAYTHDELVAEIAGMLQSRVEIHSDRLVPVDTDPGSRIVRAVRRALPGTEPEGSPTLSDWVFLSDIPVVKIGPGESRLSHTPDENLPLDSLEAGVDSYLRIIEAYFEADHG